MLRFSLLILGPFLASALHAAPIERIWLTHAVNDSSRITVNWETTQPGTKDAVQHLWYAAEVARRDAPFVITVNNERNATMRGYDGGVWAPFFQQSSAVITGYGYFGERAEVDGVPYFNTCLKGNGDLYKDPKSAFVTQEDNYLLLTFTKNSPAMTIIIKNMRGETLDTRVIKKR